MRIDTQANTHSHTSLTGVWLSVHFLRSFNSVL